MAVTVARDEEGFGLLLCEPADPVAAWLGQRLRARGLRVEPLTSESLCLGARWSHRLGRDPATFDVSLADSRRILSAQVCWVLNRLYAVPAAFLVATEDEDRAYAEQEWRALLCSALETLRARGVPVVDAPDPYALAGRWRSPGEWAMLAHRSGLRVDPWRWHDELPDAPREDGAVAALVVGARVLSPSALPVEAEAACRRLAGLAQAPLLHVALVPADDGVPRFLGAAPMPDLRAGGEPAVDALVAVLCP